MPNFLFLALALTSSLLQHNVLVDSENRALLADFGFARVSNPPGLVGVSDSNDPGGTTRYMAPELFVSVNDGRSTYEPPIDVFALGSLIYEVLC